MTKKAKEKVLTKWEAISLACEAARFCGISQADIIIINAVMDVKIAHLCECPQKKIVKQN